MTRYAIAGLLTTAVLSGCGGDSPSGRPTTAATPQDSMQAGTDLTFLSAEDGRVVASASAILPNGRYAADAGGQVTLSQDVRFGTEIDIVADGFLDRYSLIRSASATTFTLWPKTSASGLDENQTAELVYTSGSYCCPADESRFSRRALTRIAPEITVVPVVLDPAFRGHPSNVQAVTQAADAVTAVAGGAVRFAYAEAASGPSLLIAPGEDPRDIAAFADLDFDARGYVVGGALRVKSNWVDYFFGSNTRNKEALAALMAHEMGHALGFHHSSRPGMMQSHPGGPGFYRFWYANHAFSPIEATARLLMYQRPAGNHFPDDDRDVARLSRQRTERIACVVEPPIPD